MGIILSHFTGRKYLEPCPGCTVRIDSRDLTQLWSSDESGYSGVCSEDGVTPWGTCRSFWLLDLPPVMSDDSHSNNFPPVLKIRFLSLRTARGSIEKVG